MPILFREQGFRFHVYSNEDGPRAPIHIHVARDHADAKLWLYPEVAFAYDCGFDARTCRWLMSVVEARRTEIEDPWNDHFARGAKRLLR